MPNESGGPEGHTAYLNGRFAPPEQVDYKADEYWAKRRLCPTHLLVHDVVLQPGSSEASTAPTMLETQEKLSSSFLPALKMRHWLATNLKPDSMTPNRQERLQLKSMVTEYGWMNALRLEKNELSPSDSGAVTKCRWMRVLSTSKLHVPGC